MTNQAIAVIIISPPAFVNWAILKAISGGEELTHLMARIGIERGQELAREVVAMMWQNTRESLTRFKVFCESGAK